MNAAAKIIELLLKGGLPDFEKLPKHGIVHKRTTAKINGETGFLVWDYLAWNEITFDAASGEIYSFFNSRSDKETEDVWNELVKKFGT